MGPEWPSGQTLSSGSTDVGFNPGWAVAVWALRVTVVRLHPGQITPEWPSGLAPSSRLSAIGFSPCSLRSSHISDLAIGAVLAALPGIGVIGSALGLIGPVSVSWGDAWCND